MRSAIYHGVVTHSRSAPVEYRFRFRLWMAYLDLAELAEVMATSALWSLEGRTPIAFRRADYLGPPDQNLDEAVRDVVADRMGVRPDGPIRMLAHLRTWGWCFNPITLYFCFAKGAPSSPGHLVVDVMNTPWHERRSYVLDWSSDRTADGAFEVNKALHVSPFLGMDLRHRIRCDEPGETFNLRIDNTGPDADGFRSGLALRRQEMNSRSMASVLVRHPALTHRVSASIHRHALALWAKRVPFRTHPDRTGPR